MVGKTTLNWLAPLPIAVPTVQPVLGVFRVSVYIM